MPHVPGVIPMSYDMRDRKFDLPKIGAVADLGKLPWNGLGRKPISIEDQLATNFCTAGTSNASEYQEKVQLAWEFQVAAISRLLGKPILGGCDARTALEAAIAYGSLEQKDAPYTLKSALGEHGEGEYELRADGIHVIKSGGIDFIAEWRNWPDALWQKAKEHLKGAYAWVNDMPYDKFDSIRAALYGGRNEDQVIMVFGKWYAKWSATDAEGRVPEDFEGAYTWHFWIFYDWEMIAGQMYLLAQLSSGTDAGKGGIFKFPRSVINKAFAYAPQDQQALAVYVDASPEDIEKLKQQRLSLLTILLEIYRRILAKLFT